MRLRDELELKVRILALPVDICVQQAVKGNSALQGVLDVALSVLRDIEEFEESLSQQEVATVRLHLARGIHNCQSCSMPLTPALLSGKRGGRNAYERVALCSHQEAGNSDQAAGLASAILGSRHQLRVIAGLR